jgi:ATP-dependent RNA helicase RhlB
VNIVKKILGFLGITFESKNPAATNNKKQKKKTQDKKSAKIKNSSKKNNSFKGKEDYCEEEFVEYKAKEIPPVPQVLQDVPQAEGKLRFLDLPIHNLIQHAIQSANFKYCTEIQKLALPSLLEKKDLAAKAQTGTGKTAAFLISTFNYLLNNPIENQRPGTPRALVLSPTRELAVQINKDAQALSLYSPITSLVVFGGMAHEQQRQALLSPVDLVVGTPGRIIDFVYSGYLDLSKVEVLVIDEADRMLDMGFIPDVKKIVYKLPPKGVRQTQLFSATLTDDILRLSKGWLTEPEIVESEPEKMVNDNIDQIFYSVSREEKLGMVLHLLKDETGRVIIFGNRKDVNLKLQHDLSLYGYAVPVLSGDIPQNKRMSILEKFRTGEEKIIIATDVAARGIHVDDVSLVINYDLPERSEDYIHRIGRTGRAGHTGRAISFLCEYGSYYLPAIEELLNTTFSSIAPTNEMLELPPKNPVKVERIAPQNNQKSNSKTSRNYRSIR